MIGNPLQSRLQRRRAAPALRPVRRATPRVEWLATGAGLLGIIALWQLVVTLGDYPPFVLPAPATVAAKLLSTLADGTLWKHARVTLLETVLGFALGFASATLLGYALAKQPLAERLAAPWLVTMQAVPVVAVAPLLIIWFGSGLLSKVLICALIVFFPVLVNSIVGLRSVDQEWQELMTVLGASRWQRFRLVELPGALPVLFGGIRLGVTLAVVGAVVGEFVGSSVGLGALINIARGGLYDTPLLFVALFALALLALTLYGLAAWAERRIVRWRR